jgi:hypothetical protein
VRFYLILCVFYLSSFSAQELVLGIGGSLRFGTHENALGFKAQIGILTKYCQFNLANQSQILFTSYGNRKQFVENRFSSGLVLLAGKEENPVSFEYDAVFHQSKRNLALGFSYIWYADNVGTSQLSGSWSLQLQKVQLLFENDVFGGQAKDRFRSGTLRIAYLDSVFHPYIVSKIWTGETKGSIWKKEALPGCPNGYRSLAHLPYGKTSHGIFAIGLSTIYGVSKISMIQHYWGAELGLDSEQIRHFFQNRMSHDLIFMPKFYPRHTPHYPRLDGNGMPIFSKDLRKNDRFYFEIFYN